MPRLPSLTPKQVIRQLKRLGFIEDRTTGSHVILYNSETGKRAVVPFHLKDVPKGTLSAILRESGVSRKEFLKKSSN